MRIFQSCIKIFLFTLVSTSLTLTSNAGESKIKALQYPELQVSPLASERLKIESDNEDSRKWKNALFFQISALTTLVSSLTVDDQPSASPKDQEDLDNAKTIGTVVGLGWLISNALLARNYQPYATGLKEVSGMPNKSEREQITRERLAEEALQRPASLITRLKWISFITNLGASVMLASYASDETIAVPIISAVLSTAPLFFKHRWEHVNDQHQLYKKKIYGPLVSASLIKDSQPGKFAPGIAVSLNF